MYRRLGSSQDWPCAGVSTFEDGRPLVTCLGHEDGGKASSHSGMDNVQTAELEELSEDKPVTEEEKRKLDAILDIPVTISMEEIIVS